MGFIHTIWNRFRQLYMNMEPLFLVIGYVHIQNPNPTWSFSFRLTLVLCVVPLLAACNPYFLSPFAHVSLSLASLTLSASLTFTLCLSIPQWFEALKSEDDF